VKIALDYNAALRQIAGIGRYTRELVRAFLQRNTGDELILFYAARDLPPDHWGLAGLHQLQAEFPQVRAAPIPLPERWLTIVWQRARLPLALERFTGPIDLLHAPDFVLPPVRHAPTLLTVHDLTFRIHPETAFANLRRYLDHAVPRSLARASHVLADSLSTQRDLERLMQVPASKITVLYPGVGAQFRRVTDAGRLQALRDRYALPERFLFFIGTLEPRKNLTRLIEAYVQVLHASGSFPDSLPLVLGGKPGWLSDGIVERARHTPGVRMLGPVDDADLPLLYTLATATVYPSLYEGFGFPVLESLACGTPVLTSNTSSLPEVAGDLCVLVDPADVGSIAAGIERLLSDPALTQAAREHGPQQAARFSWDAAAAQLNDLYRSIAQPA
jgi:glycosyltransferase involved in cell wall biosynthesis